MREVRNRHLDGKHPPFVRLLKLAAWIAVLWGCFYVWIWNVGNIALPAGGVTVEANDTLSALPARLHADVGTLRYRLWLAFFSPVKTAYPGQYNVPEDASLKSMLKKIGTKATAETVTVTILPGWNVFDVDGLFAQKGIAENGEVAHITGDTMGELRKKYPFLEGRESLEGFLYPDTYDIDPKKGLIAALGVILGNFAKKMPDANAGEAFYRTLILASVVEKEERNPDNKPVVAGILQNRLNAGMPLGADATTCYGFSLTTAQCKQSFIQAHVHDATGYNTRSKPGLPPTPICNPTKESVAAAQNPAQTPYLYYLHGKTDGVIRYAHTLDEHNANIRKYE